ncbi:MAG: NUDIX domain-containing protein [Caldilineaceae bacterium SB0670_bin_27]|nr:NUDIX domain-containing protein [Caldilineaceae bacterium SB0670_bin_27]
MVDLTRIAPLAASLWRVAPDWVRGAVTWMVNGKVLVGVSGALLNDDNQVLLLRHRFHNTRIWGLPGGWLSRGETVYDCWRREVKEELALEVSVEAILCHRSFRHTLAFSLLGRISGGQMKVDPVEILAARLFSPDNLPPMEGFSQGVVRQAYRKLEEESTSKAGEAWGQSKPVAGRDRTTSDFEAKGEEGDGESLEKGNALHA